MKVAVIGGTGSIGGGLAQQLSKNHEIIIGSREPAKAKEAAARIPGAKGTDYLTAARECDAAIFAIPYSAIDVAAPLAGPLAGKLAISTINPMKFENGILLYGLESGSAAEALAARLPKSRVSTAFNNITAGFFKKTEIARLDTLVAADTKQTFEETAALVKSIPNLRPLHAGPLSEAQSVERITPLILNLAKINSTGSLATRFVSQRE